MTPNWECDHDCCVDEKPHAHLADVTDCSDCIALQRSAMSERAEALRERGSEDRPTKGKQAMSTDVYDLSDDELEEWEMPETKWSELLLVLVLPDMADENGDLLDPDRMANGLVQIINEEWRRNSEHRPEFYRPARIHLNPSPQWMTGDALQRLIQAAKAAETGRLAALEALETAAREWITEGGFVVPVSVVAALDALEDQP